MTPPSNLETPDQDTALTNGTKASTSTEVDPNEIPDDVEMSLFDHLEELRMRLFYALIAIIVGGCRLFYPSQPNCCRVGDSGSRSQVSAAFPRRVFLCLH